MWRILIKTGIAPPGITGAEDDDKLPAAAGVGFSDVGAGHPGTDSAAFSSQVFVQWRQEFYTRMRAHLAAASAAMGCTCGLCGAPALVAFTGKRQYMELLNFGK
ncbi:UDG domain-containing protein [Haematococcus lacustris]|uniref:UDG domain-containing protein n=1 Tax=Haematococcus lacustris TaxID=44745 RepID=A0A699YD97_HAELA|nr:UDG domain-containing protein [Haematococcus lacustris]